MWYLGGGKLENPAPCRATIQTRHNHYLGALFINVGDNYILKTRSYHNLKKACPCQLFCTTYAWEST